MRSLLIFCNPLSSHPTDNIVKYLEQKTGKLKQNWAVYSFNSSYFNQSQGSICCQYSHFVKHGVQ